MITNRAETPDVFIDNQFIGDDKAFFLWADAKIIQQLRL